MYVGYNENNNVCFSKINNPDEWEEPQTLIIKVVPKKWWSIKEWLFAKDFEKHMRIVAIDRRCGSLRN